VSAEDVADEVVEAIETAIDFDKLLAKLSDRYPDESCYEITKRAVAKTKVAALRLILAFESMDRVADRRRAQAREVEKDARDKGVREPEQVPEPEDERQQSEPPKPPEPNHRPGDFQRLYNDPMVWHGRDETGILLRERVIPAPEGFSYLGESRSTFRIDWTAPSRRQFEEWCEDTYGEGAFQGWLDRCYLLDADNPDEMERWEIDWVPEFRREWAQLAYHRNKIAGILDDFRAAIRFEVTAELLDTVFATGDGTRVSWRDATVLQHEERIEMLSKMMAGTAETAAMHMRAVEMIKDAGVESLGQVPRDA